MRQKERGRAAVLDGRSEEDKGVKRKGGEGRAVNHIRGEVRSSVVLRSSNAEQRIRGFLAQEHSSCHQIEEAEQLKGLAGLPTTISRDADWYDRHCRI